MIMPRISHASATSSFGYYWWILPERNIHYMNGHGGQFAFIVPNKHLVVVSTAIPNTQGEYQIRTAEILPYLDRIVALCD
jgi:CubicO group peptidase (beta-lactamase class C family)